VARGMPLAGNVRPMHEPMSGLDPLPEVTALLAAHGITPPAGDLEALAEVLPSLRGRMQRLHAVDCGDL